MSVCLCVRMCEWVRVWWVIDKKTTVKTKSPLCDKIILSRLGTQNQEWSKKIVVEEQDEEKEEEKNQTRTQVRTHADL